MPVWLSKKCFWPSFHSLLRLVKGTTKRNTLLLIELDRRLIGSGGLLLEVSPPHICSPGFSFMGVFGRKVNN